LTTFLLACAGLVVLSGLFLLFPGRATRRPVDDGAQANLDWYRLRRAELADAGEADLETDTQLRLLEDQQGQLAAAATEEPARRAFPLWALVPVVAVMAAVLYYQLGSVTDVRIAQQLGDLGETPTEAQLSELMVAIEERASQRPDNLHYLALLGRYQMGQGDYALAAESYDRLVQAAPEDPQALAYSAQARFLADGRTLSPSAQARAEQALAIDPQQRTALGLLGMSAFERGQFRAAIQYWERLIVMEAPGSEGQQLIAGVINEARQRLGEAVSPTDEVAVPGTGVTVTVALPEGASLADSDTVFVLARAAGSESRMPIAAQRLAASQLPATLRLDDNSTMAGQKLSTAGEILVLVQVSPAGTPGEENATWLGRLGPLQPSLSEEPQLITLQPRQG
tara:strand:- start:2427 stop:3617 length:1191 start_codon:yes stop_codon:yes gene_type:complete